MKRDDTLWKAILEDLFDDFLVFFFEEEAELFDLEKGFEFLDKELEQLFPAGDDNTGTKFVDKLVKVFTKTGVEEWILVHVEVQGYSDKGFAKRMFTYFYRILDRYDVPITCMAIFTGGSNTFKPPSFNYSFLGTSATFSYNTYTIGNQDETALRKSSNPFAIVILTVLLALKKGKIDENQLLELKIELFRNLLQKEMPKNKIRALMIFLHNYVRLDNAELISKFDQEISLLTNLHTTMGIEEFILQRVRNESMEIMKTEDNLRFVKSLLTQTDFTAQRIAQIADVPVAFVEEVKAALLKPSN